VLSRSVRPAVPSLAASGGTLSGTADFTFSGVICGESVTDQSSDSVTGTVSSGGAVTLNL
jgi:hypothetical protein